MALKGGNKDKNKGKDKGGHKGKRGTTDRTGSSGCGRRAKRLMLGTLHLRTFGGSGVQFLFIFCMLSMKEGSELMDRELATK